LTTLHGVPLKITLKTGSKSGPEQAFPPSSGNKVLPNRWVFEVWGFIPAGKKKTSVEILVLTFRGKISSGSHPMAGGPTTYSEKCFWILVVEWELFNESQFGWHGIGRSRLLIEYLKD
jgi:hypothetical protein